MSVTIRQVSSAVGLIISGAMREVDLGTTDTTSFDIYRAVARELGNWMEANSPSERLEVAQCIDDNLTHDELGSGIVPDDEAE